MPPTGRTFRTRACAFFLFEGNRIAVERIHFDSATMLRQLRLAHDPQKLAGRLTAALTHPITVKCVRPQSSGSVQGRQTMTAVGIRYSRDREVILNANTLETTAAQYNSMVLEKHISIGVRQIRGSASSSRPASSLEIG